MSRNSSQREPSVRRTGVRSTRPTAQLLAAEPGIETAQLLNIDQSPTNQPE